MIAGLQGVEVIVDDLLVYGKDQMEYEKNLTALLNRCREKNLTLNPNKMQIGVEEVTYFGHLLTKEGFEA